MKKIIFLAFLAVSLCTFSSCSAHTAMTQAIAIQIFLKETRWLAME